jgi:hypothetical protein
MLIATTTAPPAALAPLRDFVGHCWIAEIAEGTTDRHCFEPVYGGAHLRDRHAVMRGGQTLYAGETLYSAEAGRIGFTYWNSLGGVGHGDAAPENGVLTFRMTMRAAPDAAPQPFIVTWRRTAGGYDTATGGVTRRFRLDDAAGQGARQ